MRGKPLDERGLANRLRQYGIKSKNVRIGDKISKGYERADLFDAWQRYLPPLVPRHKRYKRLFGQLLDLTPA
jgi:hypothetical protein